MKVLIITGTPKQEGLCRSCVRSAAEGVGKAGGDSEIIDLCQAGLKRCAICGEGWGTCLKDHVCCFGDDGFTAIQEKAAAADALIFITPVYWGEMTEAMKAFFDRYRRCEAMKGEDSALRGKQVLLIASPGGSGNGMVSCFEQMERVCRHLRAEVFDFVGVNRWNSSYKLETIGAAAAALSSRAR
jgi:multimeric flavodoxin WrbA